MKIRALANARGGPLCGRSTARVSPAAILIRSGEPQDQGVRRLVAAMARVSEGKRRQVAALHIALVICPSFALIPRQKLSPTSNCTRRIGGLMFQTFIRIVAAIAFWAAAALAQQTTAALTGTVTDPTGAVVAHVTITA